MDAIRLGFVLFATATATTIVGSSRTSSMASIGLKMATKSEIKKRKDSRKQQLQESKLFTSSGTSSSFRALSNSTGSNSTITSRNKSPTSSPGSAPTPNPLYISTTQPLKLILSPMGGVMNATIQQIWSQVTSNFILSYWESTTGTASDSTDEANKQQLFIKDLSVVSTVQNQKVFTLNTNNGRTLAEGEAQQGLQITYTHWIGYSSLLSTNINNTDPARLEELLVTLPFNTLSSRANYVTTLKKQSPEAFGNLIYVSNVSSAASSRTGEQQQKVAPPNTEQYVATKNPLLSYILSNLTWIAAIAAAVLGGVGLFIHYAHKHVKRRRQYRQKTDDIVHDIVITEVREEESKTREESSVKPTSNFLEENFIHRISSFLSGEGPVSEAEHQKASSDGVVDSSGSINTLSLPRTISVGTNVTKSTATSGIDSSTASTRSTRSSTTTSTCSQSLKTTLIRSNSSMDQIESVLRDLQPNDFNVAEEFDQIMEELGRSTFPNYFDTSANELVREGSEEESFLSSTATDVMSQLDEEEHSVDCFRPTTTILGQRPSDQPGITIVCCSDVYDKIL
jgi:hypothetical protein